MKFDCIGILYRKEMLDFLRDRRTIISMFVAPIVLMPVSMIGTTTYLAKQRETAKVKRYTVGLHENAPTVSVSEALSNAGLTVKRVADAREAAESKKTDFALDVTGPSVTIYADLSEMTAQVAKARIKDALDGLRRQRIRDDLKALNVRESILTPFKIEDVNLAKPRKMTGSILGSMLGFVLMIIMFNGAMYAAVDMTAGEKERRTMEMLLSSAASREEIVVGKILASVTTSFLSAVLTFASFVAGFMYMGHANADIGKELQFPTDPATLSLIALSIVPMCILAAGCAVALATPAKSVREATSYLTLVLFIPMMLGASTFLPGIEHRAIVDLIPVGNFMRLIRQLLLGEWSWMHFGTTLGINVLYAAIAAATAIRQFRNESILFRT
jgi:sodium transport system permease protein